MNDPDDPGGATNHGVTIHTMRRLGLDLTGDGKVDATDVRALESATGRGQSTCGITFRSQGSTCCRKPLQASVFDMQVNAGAQRGPHPPAADGGLRAAAQG